MGFEYKGPPVDPATPSQPVPAQQSSANKDDDTQPRRAIRPAPVNVDPVLEPSYREHVSQPLSTGAAEAPHFYPENLAYQPVQPQPGPVAYPSPQPQYGGPGQPYVPPVVAPQPGYYPYGYNYAGYAPPQVPYPGYPGHYSAAAPPLYPYTPYLWQPPRPKRDGYLFAVSIIAFICSILVIVGGLISGFFLVVTILASSSSGFSNLRPEQVFGSIVLFAALTLAGLAGGGFSVYHSVRSLFFKKPSAAFKLPPFWIFLILYVVLIAIGFVVGTNTSANPGEPLTILLVLLAGSLPALVFLALAVRRLRYPRTAPWATTWRRFTLSIVSGATLAIVLALILELVLTVLATLEFHAGSNFIDNPNQPVPDSGSQLILLLIIVSVIAPLVEEGVKPLAAITMIGRIRNAAEAFILGMACGVGFDLIETSGYIGNAGMHNWVYIALERSVAGLLHGFGAGMVALGWYYLTHKHSVKNRIWIGLACCVYAVLQHAIWNGSFVLQLLPAPIGPYLQGTTVIGSVRLPAFLIVELALSLLMLIFFLFVTGKIRTEPAARQTATSMPNPPMMQQQYSAPRS